MRPCSGCRFQALPCLPPETDVSEGRFVDPTDSPFQHHLQPESAAWRLLKGLPPPGVDAAAFKWKIPDNGTQSTVMGPAWRPTGANAEAVSESVDTTFSTLATELQVSKHQTSKKPFWLPKDVKDTLRWQAEKMLHDPSYVPPMAEVMPLTERTFLYAEASRRCRDEFMLLHGVETKLQNEAEKV